MEAQLMQNMPRKFLLAAGGLLALIMLSALLLWAFVSSGIFKKRIEGYASQVLGMELTVDGPIRILVSSKPGLRLEDIHLRKDETEWIRAAAVDLRVRALPLLRGQVELDSIDLLAPDLQLKLDFGKAFNFFPAHGPENSNEGPILKIPRFQVKDANLTLTDRTSGESIKAQRCDLTGRDFVWTPATADTSKLTLPDFQAHMKCNQIIYGVMEASEVEAKVSAQKQQLKVGPVTGMLLDGQLKAGMASDYSRPAPDHTLELELTGFRVEQYVQTFHHGKGAEGSLTFAAQLSFSGRMLPEMVATMVGRASLSGTELVLHGLDLDRQLAHYESTQRFQLVDIAAFFLAGPIGLAVTRGYGFASLFADTGEKTAIRELISEWNIDNGILRPGDVALSTEENRLALAGGLDFVNSRFENMRVAVIDPKGCAVVEQLIRGDFRDPRIEKPHFLVSLVGPLVNILRQGVALFKDAECEPFYTGRLEHP
jgi:uncharacterized protein involved in outer membrane biogenesis